MRERVEIGIRYLFAIIIAVGIACGVHAITGSWVIAIVATAAIAAAK